MDPSKTVLFLPFFNNISKENAISFLAELDSKSEKGTIALVGNTMPYNDQLFRNIKVIRFTHGSSFGDALRSGLSAAIEFGAENVVTFESYSVKNAPWFIPYLGTGNIIESHRRSIKETIATEIVNVFSFHNVYNVFSMNRIYTKEAVNCIKDSKLTGRAFLSEALNILNNKGLKTKEIINKSQESASKKIVGIRDVISSIIKSFNKSSLLYSVFSFLAYVVNILFVYFSLSIGFFYPTAVFIGGEVSLLSNFLMNEKISLNNNINMPTFRRLGAFSIIGTLVLAADIIMIGLISMFLPIGRFYDKVFSIAILVAMSAMSVFFMNKLIWNKKNNIRIEI